MIKAQIVADSLNVHNNSRLVTFLLVYPRYIHSEILTHRVFSRNSASSRAIPVEKMIAMILKEPARPIHWGVNKKGMQADTELSSTDKGKAIDIWNNSCNSQVRYAKRLLKLGIHKQVVNRLLEPFAHMTTLLSGTEWTNFFSLRCDKHAMPEFQELAFQILELFLSNKPDKLLPGQWHIPFGDKFISECLCDSQLLKIATARAARTSYVNFDGDIQHDKDYELHDRLLTSGHMSCFEHCAQAMKKNVFWGNFKGWKQYRKNFKEENRTNVDLKKLLQSRSIYGS